jgi:hypothetical protein
LQEEQDAWYEGEEVEGSDEGISPLCSMLYQYSGKCNKHLNAGSDYNTYQMYQSETQQDNEDAVCAFIETVRSSTYNEKGQITFGFSSLFSKNGFRSASRSMSGPHKAALWIMGLGVGVMLVSAMWLQNQLTDRNISWRPRRFARPGPSNQAFLHTNSGITRDRSLPESGGIFT